MKKYKFLPVVFLIFYIVGCSTTPEREKVLSEKSVTWLGVDYSLAKFTGIDEDPGTVVEKLSAINNVIVNESKKYNVKKFFKKNEVVYDLNVVNNNNSKINAAKISTTGVYSIAPDDVKRQVNSYNLKGKTGMGLVFVAENLNKDKGFGTYYICFFDLATKEIIESTKVKGKAGGFGFRNYWSRSVLEVMKRW